MSLTKFASAFSVLLFLTISYAQAKILINRQYRIEEVDDKCLVVKQNYVDFSGCKETALNRSPPPLLKYTSFHNAGGTPVRLTLSKPLLIEGQQQSSWISRTKLLLGGVFGVDSRTMVGDTTIPPYSGIGQISNDCTGAKIGPRHILTAAHCVVYEYRAHNVDWTFAPGRDSKYYKPFGEYGWVLAYVPDEYLNRGKFYYNYDYAIVILKQDLSDEISTFKFDFECNHPSVTAELNIVGYPSDKREGTMWKTGCSNLQIKCAWKFFSHNCDTEHGMSGSPMFAEIQKDDGAIDQVIYGIHQGDFDNHNHAIVMSPVIQAKIKQWLTIFSPGMQVDDQIEPVSDQIAPVSSSNIQASPDAMIAQA